MRPTPTDQHLSQRGYRHRVLSLKDEPMRCVASPPVAVFQLSDQFDSRHRREAGRGGVVETFGSDSVNAPAVAPAGQVQMRGNIKGDVYGFEKFSRHVQNIERAVGRIEKVDRPKPVVAGAGEFRIPLGPARREGHAVGFERSPMDEVVLGATGKNVAVETLRVGVSTVNRSSRDAVKNAVAGAG